MQSIANRLDGELLLDDLDNLARIGGGAGKGINRLAYSPTDLEGRAWVEAKMRELGMTTHTDSAGNTIGRYPGSQPDLPPIALGSHTDTVPDGGKYDGALGVLGALACIRTLRDNQIQTRHPIEVINFAAEEASMPGSTFGSRAMAGRLTPAILEQAAWDGQLVKTHLESAGMNPKEIFKAARPAGSLAAYMELHIEQGGFLDKAGIPVGLVVGIVGIRRFNVIFNGYANHAGTTRMEHRQDALVMAAPFIPFVRDVAIKKNMVGTIGSLRVYPNAPNVIPGKVELIVEIRSLYEEDLDSASAELRQFAEQAGATFTEISSKPPVMSDARVLDALAEASQELGLPSMKMPSGAGHDAMLMAELAPEAMLFVPSHNGVSHSPDEYTEPEQCVNGARVLLSALLKLDALFDS